MIRCLRSETKRSSASSPKVMIHLVLHSYFFLRLVILPLHGTSAVLVIPWVLSLCCPGQHADYSTGSMWGIVEYAVSALPLPAPVSRV